MMPERDRRATTMTCDVLIENLRCTAPGGRTLLDLPHLAVEAGERIAIVGPNGAGKSTLLRCLSGFLRPQGGRVQVLQRELGHGLAARDLRRLRCELAQVLQGLHLVHRLTVVENVLIGALGRLPGWRSWVRWHRPADVAEAMRALAAVGLEAKAGDRTDRLSGGERQKVCIARLMMQRPRLILADEPTASLDPAAARDICGLLRQCAAQATLISVVHQAELLPWLADRVIGLRDGRLVFDLRVENLDPDRLSILYGPNDVDTANGIRGSSATRRDASGLSSSPAPGASMKAWPDPALDPSPDPLPNALPNAPPNALPNAPPTAPPNPRSSPLPGLPPSPLPKGLTLKGTAP